MQHYNYLRTLKDIRAWKVSRRGRCMMRYWHTALAYYRTHIDSGQLTTCEILITHTETKWSAECIMFPFHWSMYPGFQMSITHHLGSCLLRHIMQLFVDVSGVTARWYIVLAASWNAVNRCDSCGDCCSNSNTYTSRSHLRWDQISATPRSYTTPILPTPYAFCSKVPNYTSAKFHVCISNSCNAIQCDTIRYDIV